MRTKKQILLFTVLVMFLCLRHGVFAENLENGDSEMTVPAQFERFCENAAGRFNYSNDYETAVLELIPAFGRLFASAAYYMEGGSLYSYYAAELTPACIAGSESCGDDTEFSFALNVRYFSNMSYAGNYWPGDTSQRLTLNDQGLLLSDYEGDGDPLLSAEAVQLFRDSSAASVFVYAPEGGSVPEKFSFEFMVPEYLEGDWRFEQDDSKISVSFGADKKITLLYDPVGSPSEKPSEIYIGTYSLLKTQADIFVLCYIMSRPDSGTMPYEGCARLQTGGPGLTVSRIGEDDCLLIPGSGDTGIYSRVR